MEDLTPKFNLIPSSVLPGGLQDVSNNSPELTPTGTLVQPKSPELGETAGPFSLGANTATVGSGNDIFKVSPLGIHLGHAEFASAPFRVDMQGNVTATNLDVNSLDIPDTITANSFHVDTEGNTWWGATTLGSAVAKVLKTGAATFNTVTINNGTIQDSNIVYTYTAGEDLTSGDIVYPTGNDIVERVRPTSFASSSGTFTEPDNVSPDFLYKILKIDATRTLHLTGGSISLSKEVQSFIGTINAGETDMTYGGVYNFSTANSYSYDVCQFDTNKFLVIYERANVTADCLAVVLDVGASGGTITAGTIAIVDTDMIDTASVCCAKLDSGRVAVTYYDGTDYKVQILSISGTTITTNTPVQVHSSGVQTRASLCLLTTDKLLCVFAGDSSDPLVAKTIDVSSTTPTVNGSNTLNSTSYEYTIGTMAVLSSTKVAMVYTYSDGAADNKVQAAILTISGSTVTKGTDLQLGTGFNQVKFYLNVLSLGASVLLTATRTTNTNTKYHLLFVDGTTITSTTTQDVTNAGNNYQSTWVCKFKPFKYLGVAGTEYSFVTLGSTSNKFIGTAFNTIADTVSGLINMRYVKQTTFTGLTAGSIYYIDDNGTPSTENSTLSVTFGIALNTTSMLVQ